MAEDRLQYYTQAMEIDVETDKPMPKVAIVVPGDSGTGGALPVTIQGASESGGALKVILDSSNLILPVDIQARMPKTITTHSGVVVAPAGNGVGTFFDCDGFDKVGLTVSCGTAPTANSKLYLNIDWSSDGTSPQGIDIMPVYIPTGVTRGGAVVEVKAKWCRVTVVNVDTPPHTVSAWSYLKP